MPRSKSKLNSDIPKRLQIELQSLIAYTCYDSDNVLQNGKSAKRDTVRDKMFSLYMPSSAAADADRVSYVELLLEGKGWFKHLFDPHENFGED